MIINPKLKNEIKNLTIDITKTIALILFVGSPSCLIFLIIELLDGLSIINSLILIFAIYATLVTITMVLFIASVFEFDEAIFIRESIPKSIPEGKTIHTIDLNLWDKGNTPSPVSVGNTSKKSLI